MIRVLFVCHGNICRSPMAEMIFKDMVAREGIKDKFYIYSSATSYEEIVSGVHRGQEQFYKRRGSLVKTIEQTRYLELITKVTTI